MNKIHLGLLVLSVLSSVFSQRVARYFDDDVDRGDEFIDKLLREMIIDHGHEYDPYVLEDSSIGFAKKVAFINVSGEAKLHNGYIIGLNTLHRPDHCVVREENGKLYVTADLGAGIIKCHYDGTVKFMNWGPTISLYGEVVYLETHMEFSVDAKTGRDGTLHKFYIDDMKGMKVTVSGLGPLNWVASYMVDKTASVFKGFIKKMVESKVRNHISERLPNYQFPVDDTTTDIPETEEPEEPETEAPEEPETETPEEPETEAPEEPETEAPEEPETDAPEEPETEAPEEPEEEVPEEPEEEVPEDTEVPEEPEEEVPEE